MADLDPLLKQALAALLAEVDALPDGPVGRQNDKGARLRPHRVAVHFEFIDQDTTDIHIADPRYLAMGQKVLRPWIKDEDGVIIGEAHNVQKIRVDAPSVGAIIGIAGQAGSGGGAGLAISLLQRYLEKKKVVK